MSRNVASLMSRKSALHIDGKCLEKFRSAGINYSEGRSKVKSIQNAYVFLNPNLKSAWGIDCRSF